MAQKIFDLHITMQKINNTQLKEIIAKFKDIGITKSKAFLTVTNFSLQFTGHDPIGPAIMCTGYAKTYIEARERIKRAMDFLDSNGINATFEIEKRLSFNPIDISGIERDFPGYKRVINSPSYEVHGVLRGEANVLPSHEELYRLFELKIKRKLDQIVDFSRYDGTISRVTNFHTPDQETTIFLANLIKSAHLFQDLDFEVIYEQVCIVGEKNI